MIEAFSAYLYFFFSLFEIKEEGKKCQEIRLGDIFSFFVKKKKKTPSVITGNSVLAK